MKLQSINPHDQSVVGELEITTKDQVLETVAKAKSAFKTWRFSPISERVDYLKKYRQKIADHKEEIAKLISQEMGKPLHESRNEIASELEFVDYYINEGPKALADKKVLDKGKEQYRTVYEPYGVCAVIAPWNFPLSMFNSGVLPALLAGNTIVFKPSEYSTLSQKMCADLLLESGSPDGVFNLIIGSKDVGRMLIDAPIDLVWFTGSTKAGLEIYQTCGEKFIKAICEMGGSSAGIVFADADLEVTTENLYWARFLNCGQVCSAVKRLFIEKPIFDQVLQKLIDRLKQVKIGNPLEEVDFGPLVFPEQVTKLEEVVADAIYRGAKVVIGGKRPTGKEYARGNYFEPTILTNVNLDMRIMREEVFGPVLPVLSFETEDQVIEMANNTEYGLTSEVYTTDLKKGDRIAKRLDSGVVAINTDNYFKPPCPFGGYKKSGMGREYGEIGIQEFAQVKLIAVNQP